MRGVVVAAVLVASGCGPAGVKRDLAERGWHALSSEHFELITDMDLDDARARFRRLEQLRWALVDNYSLILPGLKLPPQRFRIVHFDRCRDFREVAGEGVGGYVTRTPDFQSTRLMVTCEGGSPTTLIHELAHIINGAVFADMPLWLNEGLASYYETLRIRDGRVRVGEFPRDYASVWNQATFLLSLDELRQATPEVFYKLGRRPKNYFAAWKLVHMLNTQSPEHHARFRRYLLGLARGNAEPEAWQAAFGDLPPERLRDEYRYYQNRTELRHYEAPYRWRDRVAEPRIDRLRPGEVHATWVALQLIGTRSGTPDQRAAARAAAERHLRFMESDDPAWAGVLFWRAIVAASRGKEGRAEAIATLRTYVGREPGDHRGWLALVALQLPAELTGLEAEPDPALAALRSDVMELVKVGHSASDLNLIGWYFALTREPAIGLNFARRAIAQRPSCAGCWDTLALLEHHAGRHARAARIQKRAIGMMGDAAPDSGAIGRLKAYRRAAAVAKAKAKTGPASGAEAEAGTETGTGAETASGAETETETGTGAGTGAESEREGESAGSGVAEPGPSP